MKKMAGFVRGEILVVLFMLAMVAAWFTHVITCLIEGSWGFLIAGAILFPVAIIHGFLIWIGVA